MTKMKESLFIIAMHLVVFAITYAVYHFSHSEDVKLGCAYFMIAYGIAATIAQLKNTQP